MKYILQVSIKRVEVPDDYTLAPTALENDYVYVEGSGHLYLSVERPEMFTFFAFDNRMNDLSPIARFLFWATIQWQDFYWDAKLPKRIRSYITWFTRRARPAVLWALNLSKKRIARNQEARTGMVDFKNWDPDVFDDLERKYTSLN